MRKHFNHIDKSGKITVIDVETGETVAESPSIYDALTAVEKSVYGLKAVNFDPRIAEFVLIRLLEGDTLTAITKIPGMPSWATINRWRVQSAEFDRAIDKARQLQAEMQIDKIMAEAIKNPVDKEVVPGARLKFDQLKYLVERFHPDKYSPRKQIENTGAPATKIVINTGIQREDYNGQ